jgi:SAM-dependent methyltransferase
MGLRTGIRCPLCDRGRFAVLFESEFTVLLCRGCALVFLAAPQRDLDDYYSHQYDPGLEDHPSSHDRVVQWVLRHLPASGHRKLLEVGCGRGHVLVRLRGHGFSVFGVEPSQRAVEHARSAYGLTVACSTLEGFTSTLRDQRYDAVLLIQTLEHLANPLGALSIVRSFMASNALLFVEVPHFFSPTGLYRGREQGRYVPSLNHVFVYSAETLTAFMKRAGFDIVHRGRTLTELRIVARPSVGVHAPAALPVRPGAYWEARAFHMVTPLLLRTVEVARGVRRLLRQERRGKHR